MVQAVQVAPLKVGVILHAESMNHHAANALLKTLEEPPPDSVLILMTTAAAELLPTIRSRCQNLTIKPGKSRDAIAWLQNHHKDLSHTEAMPLLFEFGGAPVQVLNALTQQEGPISLALTHVLARPDQMESLVENWSKLDLDLLLSRWMRYVSGLQRANADPDSAVRLGEVANLKNKIEPQALQEFWQELSWNRRLVHSGSNPNITLLIEKLLLRWCALVHEKQSASAH